VRCHPENPISVSTLKKISGRAYSNVHKNINFLEKKGFLTSKIQEKGRKKRLCDVTIKGALASLFASSPTLDHSKLLERWREKDWGAHYKQPFRNIVDVSELKNLVETLCLYAGSLEEVSDEFFKAGLRNPEEARALITNAAITIKKKIGERGKYEVGVKYNPGSTAVGLIERSDGPNNVVFIVMPKEETGKILIDFFLQEPNYQRQFGVYLQLILQTIARDLMNKGSGGAFDHYFPRSRTFVLAATLPGKVASLLKYPERVLELTKNSYQDIINPLLQNREFVKGNKARLTIRALKYDPRKRDLYLLSEDEINEKVLRFFKAHGRLPFDV